MILYTLAPLAECVFPGYGPPEQTGFPQSVTCAVSGGFVQGVPTGRGIRVERVISTDPRAYLSKGTAPGAEIVLPPFSAITS